MLEQVRSQPYVTFVGVPGSGKTATARHIALILQKEGYEIFPIKEINKIEDYSNQNIPQVFVIDDVLGVFGVNEHELHMINKYSERLKDPINRKTKTLVTCREAVFRNELVSDCVLVKGKNTVLLQSKENTLNDDDKQELLEKYSLDRDFLTSDNLASSSSMFPLLCKLFSSEPKLKVYGNSFFISPIECILKELDSLRIHNKHQYVSLVLLMANKNKLSEKMLDNGNNAAKETMEDNSFAEMKCSILRTCKVPSTTDNFQLINALSEMKGTYTKKNDDEFTFIHDSMFEIIAYHFGRKYPELILQYASSKYIASYVKLDKDNSRKRKREEECEEDKESEDKKRIQTSHESETIIDLSIKLHEPQYSMLADRLFKDVYNGEFYDVFGNEALKTPSVFQKFIALLNKKSYNDLYTLLISELNNASEVDTWNYEPKKYGDEEKKHTRLGMFEYDFLINDTIIERRHGRLYPYMSCLKGIQWVIIFGHYKILQYILDQMIQTNGNIIDLFLSRYNEDHQSYSFINQTNIDNNVNSSCSDQDDDEASFIDSDSNSDIICDTYDEPFFVEQCRLLCLGCYSGDLDTVQILLKHVNTDALNNRVWPSGMVYFEKNPLIIACKYGYLDIVMALLEAGANINMCVDFETPLIAACENGQQSTVRELLKLGASVNKKSVLISPLQSACQEGHALIVEELIKAGADINLNAPIINACKENHLCIVEKLITTGVDLNISLNSESPLLAACKKGHFSIVKELLSAGVEVNKKHEGKTPLIAACDGGYFDILKLLIKAGAQIDPNDKDKTTLNFPCYWSHLSITKRLIEMESKVDLNNTNERSFIVECFRGHLEDVKEMIKRGAAVNITEEDKTPLIVACYKAHIHVVNELIEAGADVNICNEFISPLQVACYEGHLNIVKEFKKAKFDGYEISNVGNALMGACFFGHMGVVKELIECQVDVNQIHRNETPLSTTSYMGHLNILKELIKAGADVNLSNGNGTPLIFASYRGHIDIVEELIKEGADVNQKDCNKSPLTAACEGRHIRVIEALVIAGANVNQSDGYKTPLAAACQKNVSFVIKKLINPDTDVNSCVNNKTPLTMACERGHAFVVAELIGAGADFNQSDGNKTPLTAACEQGHLLVVLFLINSGVDVNQSDGSKTPLTSACELGNLDIVKMLIKAGADVNQGDGNKAPLTAACDGDNWDVIKELMKADVDVNQRDENKKPLTAERANNCSFRFDLDNLTFDG